MSVFMKPVCERKWKDKAQYSYISVTGIFAVERFVVGHFAVRQFAVRTLSRGTVRRTDPCMENTEETIAKYAIDANLFWLGSMHP